MRKYLGGCKASEHGGREIIYSSFKRKLHLSKYRTSKKSSITALDPPILKCAPALNNVAMVKFGRERVTVRVF